MSSTTTESLSKAYKLIEADELGAARAILQPILARDPDNADAWWLYAHAVNDASAAREALDNLTRLDPNYPGAKELSEQLDEVTQAAAPVKAPKTRMAQVVAIPSADGELPDLDDSIENDTRRSRTLQIIVAAILLLVVLAVIAVLLTNNSQTPQVNVANEPTLESGNVDAVAANDQLGVVEDTGPVVESIETQPGLIEPTQPDLLVMQPTEAPLIFMPEVTDTSFVPEQTEPAPMFTLDPGFADLLVTEAPVAFPTSPFIIVTDEPMTPPVAEATDTVPPVDGGSGVALSPTTGDFALLLDSLNAYLMPSDPIAEASTELGRSLILSVCSRAGQEVRSTLPVVMNVLSQNLNTFAVGYESIGARLMNCETQEAIMVIVTDKTTAGQYAAGQITQAEFEAMWRPQ